MITSAEARPIPLRARPDLQVQPLVYAGRRYWGIKDPVALGYFQLRDEEHFIWRLLDGRRSLEQIKQQFEREYPPHELDVSQLQAFFSRLHRDNLVLAHSADQGQVLLERRYERTRNDLLAALANVLAIRFRGVNPSRFLDWLYARVGWLTSPWMLAVYVMLMAAAAILLASRPDAVFERLPEWSSFLTIRNAFWLAAAVGLSKVLHEFGHALTCKRMGGQCHELGLMLLVFTPCLYCNVSDAWMLPSKWQRIAISAAGIIVELVIASLCAFVWWFSEPGLVNALAFNLMMVCGVGTLLFNGNPLLRYDGYYVLSDLIEVPNLHEQAGSALRRIWTHGVLGMEAPNERLLPDRSPAALALFAVASFAYRVFIAGALLLFVRELLKPYRLALLSELLAVALVVGLVGQPAWRAYQFLSDPLRRRQMNWFRAGVRLAALAAVVAACVFIPLPCSTSAPVLLEPLGARRVYVTEPGTLVESLKLGDEVKEGQALARLENHDVTMEVEKLRSERDQQRLHVAHLTAQQIQDEKASAQLPTAMELLADLNTRYEQRLREQTRLTLKAPIAGTVLPPPAHNEPPPAGKLPTWTGTPLEVRNHGAYLATGTLLCLVGNPERFEAVAVIDQRDVGRIRPGQQVDLLLDESRDQVLHGKVIEIAQRDVAIAPREIVARGDLPTKTDKTGEARPLSTSYQARIEFDSQERRLLTGSSGRARFHVEPESIAQRVGRFFASTFRMRW